MNNAATERTEWIVQAKLPERHVAFARKSPDRRPVPSGVTNDDAKGREQQLLELFRYLSSELAVKPVLLRAAGAVSVCASAEELERISTHPLVKRIEPNRKLR